MKDLLLLRRNLMEKQERVLRLICYPYAYDDTDYSFTSITNPENAYASHTSTDFAHIAYLKGYNHVFFLFDTSSIPANATIISVSCIFRMDEKGSIDYSSIQLYSGTTPKGRSIGFRNNQTYTYTLNVGTWTRQELSDVRLRLYGRVTSNSAPNYYMRPYGATLTIEYTV